MKPASYAPTDEQAAIISAFKRGEQMKVQAGAGTGKTSTLRFLAEAKPEATGVAFAYNRAIAEDLKRTFPANCFCSTAHSLAYRAVGKRYSHRLNGPRLPARVLAEYMDIRFPLELSADLEVSRTQLARCVMDTIGNFCHSAEAGIRKWMIPGVNGIDGINRDKLEAFIMPKAEAAWQDIIYPDGKLKFEHDHYLKIWALTNPQLNADFVMLDEAQDANPVISAVVENQRNTQRILVGDSNQAIYGWRGAKNAMRNFSGSEYYLTQSFRFGPAVAEEANKWLTYLDSPLRLRGFEKINSELCELDEPDAILCRTNAGAMLAAIQNLSAGLRTAIVGGGDSIRYLAKAADDLLNGGKTEHPELFMFKSWDEVRKYAKEDGTELRPFVKLVDDLGTDAIVEACDALSAEDSAQVVISTAHKSKGREWDAVRIHNDFRQPKDEETGIDESEAMLAYVSVTRAKQQLDREGLAWVDSLLGEDY